MKLSWDFFEIIPTFHLFMIFLGPFVWDIYLCIMVGYLYNTNISWIDKKIYFSMFIINSRSLSFILFVQMDKN